MQINASSNRKKTKTILSLGGILAIAALISVDSILTKYQAQGNSYTCEFHTVKTPCNVWRDGNRISIGGFQAAPIFTLQSPWKATDHRGYTYKVMKGNGYILFNPAGDMNGTALTIYGLKL